MLGLTVVGDFGLCYLLEREQERVTNLEEAVGARGYMAPECEGGRQETVHPSSDVYSLGKILYWMLAGKSFARERHRSEENDLSRDPSDFAMQMVYELLDKTVVEDGSQRLLDAGAVIAELDAVVQRITRRRRAVELARKSLSMSGPQGVKIVSFHAGGLPDWRSFDPGSAAVLGFAGRGQMFAAWGVEERGENERVCLAWVGGPHGGWQVKLVEVNNPCAPQGAGYQALCVDERGGALLMVSNAEGEIATAHLVRLRPGGAVTVELFAERVGAPRNCALATGPAWPHTLEPGRRSCRTRWG